MTQASADRKPSQPFRPAPAMPWASRHVAHAQTEALYAVGELVLFTLMWRPVDFEAGLVGHCTTCFDGAESRQARAFKQPTKRECPDCYGTTYEGGFRAQIIRPALMADRNAETTDAPRGVVTIDTISFETTPDFTLHKGDYLFRFDNTRFQCEERRESIVRTGFVSPMHADSFAALSTAHLEDNTSVAFRIPPTDLPLIQDVLVTRGGEVLPDLDAFSLVRPGGYLLDGVPVPATGTGLRRWSPGMWTGHGPPPEGDWAQPEDEYLDLDTGTVYRMGG